MSGRRWGNWTVLVFGLMGNYTEYSLKRWAELGTGTKKNQTNSEADRSPAVAAAGELEGTTVGSPSVLLVP